MTYAAAVMWVWVLALVGTVVAFATAWRGMARAEAALRELRPPTALRGELDDARAEAEATTDAAASARRALVARSVTTPS